MGTFKKEKSRRERQGRSGPDSASNLRVKGENFYRNSKKVKTLSILKEGKPQRNSTGKVTKAASYQSRDAPTARIEPNRKWFTNTRVISQEALSSFRDAVQQHASDPYSYLLKQNKLPMSLIRDNKSNDGGLETKNGLKQHAAKMAVETQPFSDTFGPKAQRKRVKLAVSSLEDLAGQSLKMTEEYTERLAERQARLGDAESVGVEVTGGGDFDGQEDGVASTAREPIFSKGQSKRIWNELYKVIDSSDVVIHVLDARDPFGTRCHSVEKYIREEVPHKHLLFVLNKCDLVPTSIAAAWVRHLSATRPTLAFHASLRHSFGKGTLISLLRQFSQLHSHRKQITVGLIGYPNTGKSSIINALRKKKVCTVAPVPGETKVWQFVTLMRRIYLLDCPGVVPPSKADSPEDILLRGVVRVENVENPAQYVGAVLARCERRYVERTYGIKGWENEDAFLETLARRWGKLGKGGEPDMDAVAKIVLNDFMRGKIPWYINPPRKEGEEGEVMAEEGTVGNRKRKRGTEQVEETMEGGAQNADENDAVEGSESEIEVSDDEDSVVDEDYEDDENLQGFDEDTELGTEDEDEDEGSADSADATTLVVGEDDLDVEGEEGGRVDDLEVIKALKHKR
ncbi:NUC091 domain-containing protein [Lineolata rhizophorae]|uniref:Nucleolar GTP-binding protein 2 n=1 Tax=Lineolata rhizophorae TaxID=578093 RepID=A0A6A6NKS2_9PEZI|nr:NUC091 domain-containing protein [Lineolata rhizophorae]